MTGLQTDLYELTMAAGYFAAGKRSDRATFELFIRRLPETRNYLIAAGLAQAVDYLLHLRFEDSEIAFLRGLPQLANAPAEFFDYLREFRFSGDLFAVREGTPVFPGEPILTLRAPLIEAQIPETCLLSIIGFQSNVASKAARIAGAAAGRPVVEFGSRRAHSPEAGVMAARAAYIGGCVGTSNVKAASDFGITPYGTSAHSWVQAFGTEQEAFLSLSELLGDKAVHLIDTYNTREGARRVAALPHPPRAVRIDSGDLARNAHDVRTILDSAGLKSTQIMATGDLNEHKIRNLIAAGAPIDIFAAGTELATAADAPALSAVYKLVEIDSGGRKRYVYKTSADKETLPGSKQIFRFATHDVLACSSECIGCPMPGDAAPAPHVRALLEPVILSGKLLAPVPDVHEARELAARNIAALPESLRHLEPAGEPWHVELSSELRSLARTAAETS